MKERETNMKRIIPIIVLSACALAGCGSISETSDEGFETVKLTYDEPQAEKTTTVTRWLMTDTAAEFRISTTQTRSFQNEDIPEVEITEESVEIRYKGKTQTIENTKKYDTKGYKAEDYNFDGHPDLFLYELHQSSRGEYWLWDDEAKEFRYSETLALDNGKGWVMVPDYENRTLTIDYFYVDNNNRKVVLKWKDGNLVPVSMIASSREKYLDPIQKFWCYVYDDNSDCVMTDNYKLSNSSGIKIEGDKNEKYLRVTDESVQYMQGESIIQILKFDDIFGGHIDFVTRQIVPGAKEEKLRIQLLRYDFDRDGTKDLCIHLYPQNSDDSDRYIYYLMDKKTGMFRRWDAISAEGRKYLFDTEENALVCSEYNKSENFTYYYKWENEQAVLFKRKELYYHDRENVDLKIIRFDEDGNEYEALK